MTKYNQPAYGKHVKRAKPYKKVAEPNHKERQPRVTHDPYVYGWHLFGGKPGWREGDTAIPTTDEN